MWSAWKYPPPPRRSSLSPASPPLSPDHDLLLQATLAAQASRLLLDPKCQLQLPPGLRQLPLPSRVLQPVSPAPGAGKCQDPCLSCVSRAERGRRMKSPPLRLPSSSPPPPLLGALPLTPSQPVRALVALLRLWDPREHSVHRHPHLARRASAHTQNTAPCKIALTHTPQPFADARPRTSALPPPCTAPTATIPLANKPTRNTTPLRHTRAHADTIPPHTQPHTDTALHRRSHTHAVTPPHKQSHTNMTHAGTASLGSSETQRHIHSLQPFTARSQTPTRRDIHT